MAFQAKNHGRQPDTRMSNKEKIVRRETKIDALNAERTPEARKARKAMNDIVYRGSRTNLNDFWNPKGKRLAKGSGVKATKIDRALKAKTN